MGHTGLVRIIVHFADAFRHKMLPYSQRTWVRHVHRTPEAVSPHEAGRVLGCEVAGGVAQSPCLAKFIGPRCPLSSLNSLVSMTFRFCCIVRLWRRLRT